jgi:hypothetical protein
LRQSADVFPVSKEGKQNRRHVLQNREVAKYEYHLRRGTAVRERSVLDSIALRTFRCPTTINLSLKWIVGEWNPNMACKTKRFWIKMIYYEIGISRRVSVLQFRRETGKEIRKKFHHSVTVPPPPANMHRKPQTRRLKRDKPPQPIVKMPIHDTDHITKVSLVKASRMAPRTNCCAKKLEPQL